MSSMINVEVCIGISVELQDSKHGFGDTCSETEKTRLLSFNSSGVRQPLYGFEVPNALANPAASPPFGATQRRPDLPAAINPR